MKKQPNFSANQLREFVRIDADTGAIRRLVDNKRGRRVDDTAGSLHQTGYRYLQVFGRRYAAHRLVWYYFHGVWPLQDIDHINGVRDDNRLSNLRDASRQENCQNLRRPVAGNKSGFLGASKQGDKWRAHIRINGKTTYLGSFSSPELAHVAYVDAKRIHHATCSI